MITFLKIGVIKVKAYIMPTFYNKLMFFLICFLMHLQLNAKDLILIVVYEENITNDFEMDKNRVLIEGENIANFTRRSLRKMIFKKEDPRLLSTIQNISTQTDDLIWFYYSGHARNAGNSWPAFKIGDQSFAQTAIHELLLNKPHQLLITFFDSCNNGRTLAEYRGFPSTIDRVAKRNYDLLFNQTRGQIMISGATDQQYAYGNSQYGGFCTFSFFDLMTNLQTHAQETATSFWNMLANETIQRTNDLCYRNGKENQNPKFLLDISTIDSFPFEIGEDYITAQSSCQLSLVAQKYQSKGITIEKLKRWNNKTTLYVNKDEKIWLKEPMGYNPKF